jgi:hypothetical protein
MKIAAMQGENQIISEEKPQAARVERLTEAVSFYCSAELYARIERAAADEGRTLSNWARRAMASACDAHEKEAA